MAADLFVVASTVPEIAAVGTVLTAIAGAIVTALRYGPERRGVLIREEEGSFNIINSLTHTLQAEVTRLGAENSELRRLLREREEENAGLRSAVGRRTGDKDETPDA